jgi:hypothetical protein
MRCARYFCPILNRIEICQQILLKSQSDKFLENLFVVLWVITRVVQMELASVLGIFLQLSFGKELNTSTLREPSV